MTKQVSSHVQSKILFFSEHVNYDSTNVLVNLFFKLGANKSLSAPLVISIELRQRIKVSGCQLALSTKLR